MPTPDLGQDWLGLGGPDERLGPLVVLGEVAVDRGLQVDQRMEHAALQAAPGEFGKKWVSLSFPHFGGIGGNARFDDGVVGSRSDGHRLLDEAVKQEAAGL
jgi:hypothetical protein